MISRCSSCADVSYLRWRSDPLEWHSRGCADNRISGVVSRASLLPGDLLVELGLAFFSLSSVSVQATERE